jgi:hypothetical protein
MKIILITLIVIAILYYYTKSKLIMIAVEKEPSEIIEENEIIGTIGTNPDYNEINLDLENCKKVNVEKVFVLSLKSSVERRNNFITSYKSLYTDIPLEIIWGIDTKNPINAEPYRHLVNTHNYNIMYDIDTGKRPRLHESEFNSGALGCYLGHMEFYKKCFEQKLKYAIFCEDNVVLSKNFI